MASPSNLISRFYRLFSAYTGKINRIEKPYEIVKNINDLLRSLVILFDAKGIIIFNWENHVGHSYYGYFIIPETLANRVSDVYQDSIPNIGTVNVYNITKIGIVYDYEDKAGLHGIIKKETDDYLRQFKGRNFEYDNFFRFIKESIDKFSFSHYSHRLNAIPILKDFDIDYAIGIPIVMDYTTKYTVVFYFNELNGDIEDFFKLYLEDINRSFENLLALKDNMKELIRVKTDYEVIESKFKFIIENSMIFIVLLDMNLKIKWANSIAQQIIGKLDQWNKLIPSSFVFADKSEKEKFESLCEDAKKGKKVSVMVKLICQDDSTFFKKNDIIQIDMNIIPLINSKDELVELMALSKTISVVDENSNEINIVEFSPIIISNDKRKFVISEKEQLGELVYVEYDTTKNFVKLLENLNHHFTEMIMILLNRSTSASNDITEVLNILEGASAGAGLGKNITNNIREALMRMEKSLNEIFLSADKYNNITSRMHQFLSARDTRTVGAPVPVWDVLHEAIDLLNGKIKDYGIKINISFDERAFNSSDKIRALANFDRLKKIFSFIIDNALNAVIYKEFSKEGSDVDKEIIIKIERKEIGHSLGKKSFCVVTIIDKGIGMSNDTKVKVTNEMFSGWPYVDGIRFAHSGCSLLVVRRYLRSWIPESDFSIESEEDNGTSFSIFLNEVNMR